MSKPNGRLRHLLIGTAFLTGLLRAASTTDLPAPPTPLAEGLECAGWTLGRHGNLGQPLVVAGKIGDEKRQLLELRFSGGPKDKAGCALSANWKLSTASEVRFSVYAPEDNPPKIGVALVTGNPQTWHESQTFATQKGWNSISIPLDGKWKTAASNWQNTASVAKAEETKALHLLVYNGTVSGRLYVAGLLLSNSEEIRGKDGLPASLSTSDRGLVERARALLASEANWETFKKDPTTRPLRGKMFQLLDQLYVLRADLEKTPDREKKFAAQTVFCNLIQVIDAATERCADPDCLRKKHESALKDFLDASAAIPHPHLPADLADTIAQASRIAARSTGTETTAKSPPSSGAGTAALTSEERNHVSMEVRVAELRSQLVKADEEYVQSAQEVARLDSQFMLLQQRLRNAEQAIKRNVELISQTAQKSDQVMDALATQNNNLIKERDEVARLLANIRSKRSSMILQATIHARSIHRAMENLMAFENKADARTSPASAPTTRTGVEAKWLRPAPPVQKIISLVDNRVIRAVSITDLGECMTVKNEQGEYESIRMEDVKEFRQP